MTEAQKPPTAAINLLVDRYHKARLQSDEMKRHLQIAKAEMKEAQIRHQKRAGLDGDDHPQRSPKVQDGRRKLDQVILLIQCITASRTSGN